MRTTITIDDELLKKIKFKALELNLSVSGYVESLASEDIQEDLEDSKIIESRKNEPELSFDTLKRRLELEGIV